MTDGVSAKTAEVLSALAGRIDDADDWATLPPAVYRSDEIFQLEVDRIFRRGWLNVGHVSQVPEPGDFRSVDLIGQPLVMTRDKQGELHVLSRVCSHRWMDVCDGIATGHVPSLQCPYHHWTFSLDGRLRAAPEMDRTPGFDKGEFGLAKLRHEVWEGFVFVNMDGTATSTADSWSPLSTQLAEYGLSDWVVVDSRDWGESAWDWKVFMDNGECYHHLGLHDDTLEPFLPARQAVDLRDNGDCTLVFAEADPGVLVDASDGGRDFPADDPAVPGLNAWQRAGLSLAYPFPNYAIALLPQSGFWYEVRPLGAGRLHLVSHLLLPPHLVDADRHDERVASLNETFAAVHGQDIRVCERVQLGASAMSARPGMLSHLEGHNRTFARWYLTSLLSGADTR